MDNLLHALLNLFCEVDKKLAQIVSAMLPDPDRTPGVFYLQRSISFASIASGEPILPANKKRIGLIIANRSGDDVFISFDQNKGSASFFAIPIATLATDFYIPSDPKIMYKGEVRLVYKDATGFATVTEISY